MKRTTTVKFLTGAAVLLLLLMSVNSHAEDYVRKAGDTMFGWLDVINGEEPTMGIRVGNSYPKCPPSDLTFVPKAIWENSIGTAMRSTCIS